MKSPPTINITIIPMKIKLTPPNGVVREDEATASSTQVFRLIKIMFL